MNKLSKALSLAVLGGVIGSGVTGYAYHQKQQTTAQAIQSEKEERDAANHKAYSECLEAKSFDYELAVMAKTKQLPEHPFDACRESGNKVYEGLYQTFSQAYQKAQASAALEDAHQKIEKIHTVQTVLKR